MYWGLEKDPQTTPHNLMSRAFTTNVSNLTSPKLHLAPWKYVQKNSPCRVIDVFCEVHTFTDSMSINAWWANICSTQVHLRWIKTSKRLQKRVFPEQLILQTFFHFNHFKSSNHHFKPSSHAPIQYVLSVLQCVILVIFTFSHSEAEGISVTNQLLSVTFIQVLHTLHHYWNLTNFGI